MTTPSPIVDRIAAALGRIPITPLAVLIGLLITTLGVMGTLQRTTSPTWLVANLDAESGAGKWVGAGLLWAAAAAWCLVAATGRSRTPWVWIWWPIVAWLAIDEGNAVHERIERSLGVDWQVLYVPLLLMAAFAWLRLLQAQGPRSPIGKLLVIGAIAWAIPLLLEMLQHRGGAPVSAGWYDPMMITEEILEMVGAAVFFFAGALVIREDRTDAIDASVSR